MSSLLALLFCTLVPALALTEQDSLPDIVQLEASPSTINATVATADGGNTAYWIYGPTDGPRVVLIMGLAYTHYFWESTIIDLATVRGWRVLATDNRGCGKSAVTPGSYTISLLAGDVLTVLQHAGWLPPSNEAPATPIHLVGISMGGMVVQQLLLDHPNSFASAALVATYAGGNFIQTLPSFTAMLTFVEILSLGDQDLGRQVTLLHSSTYLRDHKEEAIARLGRAFGLGGVLPRDGLMAQVSAIRAFDVRKRLTEIKGRMPVVVLVGSEDKLISPKRSNDIALALNCPIYTAEGAGHGLPDDHSAGQGWFQEKLWEHLVAAQAPLQ